MKNFLLVFILLNLFISCKDEKAEPEKESEVHHEEAESNFVSLTQEQINTAGIELGQVELKNLKASIKANGTLTVPNQNKALVTSVNSGVLKNLFIQPGSFVKKGQIIATVNNPDAARLQQDLQTTVAQIELAEIELSRQRELVEGNAAPLKNVQKIQTELATLRAARNAISRQLDAMGISAINVSKGSIVTTINITAPISGTVSTVTAQIGSPVDQNTPIAQIVNNSQLHLDLFVYEKDLPRLQKNQTIHFTLTNNAGKEYDAEIYSIGTAFASESKTIPIHAIVKGNKDGLIEGMNITAVISIGQNVVQAMPSDAIVSKGGLDYIFVQSKESPPEEHHEEEAGQKEEGKNNKHAHNSVINFERIQVIKGASDIGYTEVTLVKTIPPKTPVIIKGAFFVLAKMTNTGGHEH